MITLTPDLTVRCLNSLPENQDIIRIQDRVSNVFMVIK